MGAELGCCESRHNQANAVPVDLKTAPVKRPPGSPGTEAKAAEEEEVRGDIEVLIGDGPVLNPQIRYVAGDYWKQGDHNGRPIYRKPTFGICIYYRDGWEIATELNSFNPMAMADSDEKQVPLSGWRTPKTLLYAPRDLPLTVRVIIPPEPERKPAFVVLQEALKPYLEKSGCQEGLNSCQDGLKKELAQCGLSSCLEGIQQEIQKLSASGSGTKKVKAPVKADSGEGCQAFLQHMVERSPPGLKKVCGEVLPSMKTKAVDMFGKAKESSASDLKKSLQEAADKSREAMGEAQIFARSITQDFSDAASESFEVAKESARRRFQDADGKAETTKALVRRKTAELGELAQDAQSKSAALVATASETSLEDVKNAIRSMPEALSARARSKSDEIKELARNTSLEDVQEKMKAKSAELQDKSSGPLAAVAGCLKGVGQLCDELSQPPEKPTGGDTEEPTTEAFGVAEEPTAEASGVAEKPLADASGDTEKPLAQLSGDTGEPSAEEAESMRLEETAIKECEEAMKAAVETPDKASPPPAPAAKKRGAAALLKGLRSGQVAKIVDKMEASPPPAPEETPPPAPPVKRGAAALLKGLRSGEVTKLVDQMEDKSKEDAKEGEGKPVEEDKSNEDAKQGEAKPVEVAKEQTAAA